MSEYFTQKDLNLYIVWCYHESIGEERNILQILLLYWHRDCSALNIL